jgi:hypothetical protein
MTVSWNFRLSVLEVWNDVFGSVVRRGNQRIDRAAPVVCSLSRYCSSRIASVPRPQRLVVLLPPPLSPRHRLPHLPDAAKQFGAGERHHAMTWSRTVLNTQLIDRIIILAAVAWNRPLYAHNCDALRSNFVGIFSRGR